MEASHLLPHISCLASPFSTRAALHLTAACVSGMFQGCGVKDFIQQFYQMYVYCCVNAFRIFPLPSPLVQECLMLPSCHPLFVIYTHQLVSLHFSPASFCQLLLWLQCNPSKNRLNRASYLHLVGDSGSLVKPYPRPCNATI